MSELSCTRHENSCLNFIKLTENQATLECEQCLVEQKGEYGQVNLRPWLPILKIQEQPESILKSFDIDKELTQYFFEYQLWNQKQTEKIIIDLENQIRQIQTKITALKDDLKKNAKYVQQLRFNFNQQLKEAFGFEQFQEILQSLIQKNDHITPDIIQSIEQKLHKYFKKTQLECQQQEKKKLIYSEIDEKNKKILSTKKQLNESIQNIIVDINKLSNQHNNFLDFIFPQMAYFQSNLLSDSFTFKLNQVMQQRIEKIIISNNLIYQGSKDGLTVGSFWSKVNGKSNLLMIFKTKSNFVFGAYSPCVWNKNINNYVQDGTNQSFLFSQNHEEFYPIKNSHQAIYCHHQNGPCFGGGHDIQIIGGDLRDGYSKLGHSFEWSKYKNQNSYHLFGSEKPNLVELEIYQVYYLE